MNNRNKVNCNNNNKTEFKNINTCRAFAIRQMTTNSAVNRNLASVLNN